MNRAVPDHKLEKLIILTGWGRPPSDGYLQIVEPVARAYGLEIHAPFIYGNHGEPSPPLGVAASLNRTLESLKEVSSSGRDSLVFSHSTGSLISLLLPCNGWFPAGVFATSPLIGVDYGPFGFMWRGTKMSHRHLLGTSGAPGPGRRLYRKTSAAYTWNAVRKPRALYRCLRDFTLLDHTALLRECESSFRIPVEVVISGHDDFFDYDDSLDADLLSVYPLACIRRLRELRTHEWCLLYPERARQLLIDFIESNHLAPSVRR